jgi:hypothetical protein
MITTTDTPINTTMTLVTAGGNGSGTITYSVTNGTATGCSIAGAVISVPSNVSGTCLVTATQASTSSYLGASSNVTTFNFFWQYAATYGVISSNYSYSCNSGDTLNGTWCNHNYAPTYTCSIGTLQSNDTCTYSATISSYSCSSGWTLSGSQCYRTLTTTYTSLSNCQTAGSENENDSGWVNYSCSGSGSVWHLKGYINATPNYTCPSGGTVSGSFCVGLAATASCPSGGSLSGGECTIVDDYAATATWESYNYGYTCPIAYSTLTSSTICSITGGSGPNLRRSSQRLSPELIARAGGNSMKGPS